MYSDWHKNRGNQGLTKIQGTPRKYRNTNHLKNMDITQEDTIACGESHTAVITQAGAVTHDGAVVCWGNDEDGKCSPSEDLLVMLSSVILM
jgi:alpha-tubulin suppressor-like RCC1 family protein